MKLRIPNPRLPARYAVSAVVLTLACAAFLEADALKRHEPKPPKLTCIQCHTDAKTLSAIADKSGDELYLVHNGNLTREKLNELQGNAPHAIK